MGFDEGKTTYSLVIYTDELLRKIEAKSRTGFEIKRWRYLCVHFTTDDLLLVRLGNPVFVLHQLRGEYVTKISITLTVESVIRNRKRNGVITSGHFSQKRLIARRPWKAPIE